MVKKWFERKFINFFERLVEEHKIGAIEKLDDNVTEALITYNEANDKIDTYIIKTDKRLKVIEEGTSESQKQDELTPAQILDEWLNGKKEAENE